jgi:hypothetical protein
LCFIILVIQFLLSFLRYKIFANVKGLKLSLAVRLCDPVELDDCVIDIDLLKEAVFPFPKLNADGTITFEWRKCYLILLNLALKEQTYSIILYDFQVWIIYVYGNIRLEIGFQNYSQDTFAPYSFNRNPILLVISTDFGYWITKIFGKITHRGDGQTAIAGDNGGSKL